MADRRGPKYSFASRSLPEDTFNVVDFKGVEGLSRCYEFEINLVSSQMDVDLEALIAGPAVFTIQSEYGRAPFNGILIEFEQLHQAHDLVFYRAHLAPRFRRLKETRHQQVFLNMKITDIIEAVLKDGGLTANDYALKTTGKYPTREYVCQYGESHFDFTCRWMEHYGLYYYFEQGESGEKLIITDTRLAHGPKSGYPDLKYAEISGMTPQAEDRDRVVYDFTAFHQRVPNRVRLKEYNYRRPDLDLSAEEKIDPEGFGQIYMYGDHFQTTEDGRDLAGIRAQEFLTGQTFFKAGTGAPFVSPGYKISLTDHFRDRYNTDYLTTEVEHRGSQTGYLISGLGFDPSVGEGKLFYRNQIKCIPAQTQFRPERKTPRPRLYGCLSAFIDAAGSGRFAELDDQGRYKVKLPFDLAGRQAGKASHFIRLAQPHAGPGYGFHFPLHKGCEVMLTFEDGNPDRPIISGAAPNPENMGPVKDSNQTRNIIHTAGANRLEISDQEAEERVLLHTPQANTWIRLGAPNDPPGSAEEGNGDGDGDGEGGEEKEGWWGNTEHDLGAFLGKMETKVGRNMTKFILGGSESVVVIYELKFLAGYSLSIIVAGRVEIEFPRTWELNLVHLFCGEGLTEASLERIQAANQSIRAIKTQMKTAGDQTKLVNQKVSAINKKKKTIGQKTTALNNKLTAYNQKREAVGQKTQALGQKVEASNLKQETLGAKIEDAQEAVEAVNTRVVNSGATINQIDGALTGMSAMKIRDGEAIIKM